MNSIPKSLRTWFIIHFIVDMILAIPLLFAPEWSLELIELGAESTIAVRLVGAALIGIGGNSLIMNKKSKESFQTMLDLKILWAGAAIIGLAIECYLKPSPITGGLLAVFAAFAIIWNHYRVQIK